MRMRRGSSTTYAIFVGGFAAGALDILYACVAGWMNGFPPDRILQSVASGLLGRGAFEGGAATALLGLGLHFAMTWAMAAAFVWASLRLPSLRRQPLLMGPLYGVGLYLVMNRIVLPLSAFPGKPTELGADGLLVHMVFVGLPIALAAARWTPQAPKPAPAR
jgi:hypothetical protein